MLSIAESCHNLHGSCDDLYEVQIITMFCTCTSSQWYDIQQWTPNELALHHTKHVYHATHYTQWPADVNSRTYSSAPNFNIYAELITLNDFLIMVWLAYLFTKYLSIEPTECIMLVGWSKRLINHEHERHIQQKAMGSFE